MADEGYGLQESAMKLGDYLLSTNKIGEKHWESWRQINGNLFFFIVKEIW